MLFEPSAGQFKKLRRSPKIDLGPDDVLVSEIRRQRRQLGVNVHSVTRPGRESMHGKGMAELVRARADASADRLDAELAQ